MLTCNFPNPFIHSSSAVLMNFTLLTGMHETLKSRDPDETRHIENTGRDETDVRSKTHETETRPRHLKTQVETRRDETLQFSSQLKITDRSFTHHAPVLWNALPKQFRKLAAIHSSHAIQFGSTRSLLLDLSTSQFLSKLKTHLFHKSFPP